MPTTCATPSLDNCSTCCNRVGTTSTSCNNPALNAVQSITLLIGQTLQCLTSLGAMLQWSGRTCQTGFMLSKVRSSSGQAGKATMRVSIELIPSSLSAVALGEEQ